MRIKEFILLFLPLTAAFTRNNEKNDGHDDDDHGMEESPSLISRIREHDFCRENFVLNENDQLPPNTYFLPCSSLDEHWIDCDSLNVPKMINETKVVCLLSPILC
jgi:hypothetical protein